MCSPANCGRRATEVEQPRTGLPEAAATACRPSVPFAGRAARTVRSPAGRRPGDAGGKTRRTRRARGRAARRPQGAGSDPVPCRAVRHDDPRRPRGRGAQGRGAGRRLVAGPAAELRRRRQLLLPVGQPQQEEHRRRHEDGRGPRSSSSSWRTGRISCSRTSGPAFSTVWASPTATCRAAIPDSSGRRSAASARPDPTAPARPTT